MANIGRPSTWDKHAPEMQRMYEDQGLSRGEIARSFGTSVQTVTRVLERHGVAFEDRQGGHRIERSAAEQAAINAKISAAKTGVALGPRTAAERRICEECGQEYDYRLGRSGERFCSRKCRTDFQVRLNQEEARADYDEHPRRCPCGEAIPYQYRHTRQFCSPAHRGQYQAKRQKNPDNYITFACLNCGVEVTRLKNYSAAQKYCSNECSAKHNRTRKFYAVEDLEMVFESSFECLFWSLCSFWKIPVERADRSEAVQFGENGWYCPDFRIQVPHLKLDLWIEVKGFEDDDDRARYTAWRETGRVLSVIGREELDALREAARPAAFIARLHLIENGRLLNEEPW